jgi:reverse transcriptase-like protein
MTAAMLVLDPIFEADLPSEQYAYRAGRNAQQAVIDAEETLYRGHPEVADADLADYFGSIPHADLMRSLARRIVDSRVLHLIKMWLECAVEETDDQGRKKRTTEAKDSGRGIPQGSPTDEPDVETELGRGYLGIARRKGRQQTTHLFEGIRLSRCPHPAAAGQKPSAYLMELAPQRRRSRQRCPRDSLLRRPCLY